MYFWVLLEIYVKGWEIFINWEWKVWAVEMGGGNGLIIQVSTKNPIT